MMEEICSMITWYPLYRLVLILPFQELSALDLLDEQDNGEMPDRSARKLSEVLHPSRPTCIYAPADFSTAACSMQPSLLLPPASFHLLPSYAAFNSPPSTGIGVGPLVAHNLKPHTCCLPLAALGLQPSTCSFPAAPVQVQTFNGFATRQEVTPSVSGLCLKDGTVTQRVVD